MENIYGTTYIKSENAHRLNYSGTMTREEAVAELEKLNVKPQNEQVDLDRGFGIGGINRAQENYAPTYRTIKTGTVCSECGASEADGAMFTTSANGNICDDCF